VAGPLECGHCLRVLPLRSPSAPTLPSVRPTRGQPRDEGLPTLGLDPIRRNATIDSNIRTVDGEVVVAVTQLDSQAT
jgi:hypothetical protein